MRLISILVVAVFAVAPSVAAQISIPYVFSTGTLISADEINSNFAAIAAAALNRASAATMTTSLLFSADATYDIGAVGATRPRDLFLARHLVVGGNATITGTLAVTGTITGSLNGTASLATLATTATAATALAANPTDCTGGQFANAIDASGNLTCGDVSLGGSFTGTNVTVTTSLTIPSYAATDPPTATDCDESAEVGRIAVTRDTYTIQPYVHLYICGLTGSGPSLGWNKVWP